MTDFSLVMCSGSDQNLCKSVSRSSSLQPTVNSYHLRPNTSNLYSSLSVRYQFLRPYKTTDKIIVLYILILFLGNEVQMIPN
jgi:hypothetical protein